MEQVICDECGQPIKYREDLTVRAPSYFPFFMKKFHKTCYTNSLKLRTMYGMRQNWGGASWVKASKIIIAVIAFLSIILFSMALTFGLSVVGVEFVALLGAFLLLGNLLLFTFAVHMPAKAYKIESQLPSKGYSEPILPEEKVWNKLNPNKKKFGPIWGVVLVLIIVLLGFLAAILFR